MLETPFCRRIKASTGRWGMAGAGGTEGRITGGEGGGGGEVGGGVDGGGGGGETAASRPTAALEGSGFLRR